MACGEAQPGTPPATLGLRINEVVSDNEGVFIDEVGEADDYVELVNAGAEPVELGEYALADSSGIYPLPQLTLEPGAVQLLWADDTPEQGPWHLPFKVSSSGERLRLLNARGEEVDAVSVPALEPHHAYQRIPDGVGDFVDCSWATPARSNGARCGPPEAPEIPEDVQFSPFEWPPVWPEPPSPLAINEAALRPPEFVELLNVSGEAIALGEYAVSFARHEIGEPWPTPDAGALVALPETTLAPGEHVIVPVTEAEIAAILEDPEFEGVLTLFRSTDGEVVDRVDFNAWPEGAALARVPDGNGRYRLCEGSSPGESNDACQVLESRPVGDRVRRLLTPSDFAALAAGRSALGTDSVEFLIDLAGGDVVTFLNSADWDLHYTFVREAIEKLPHLDRCDPAQNEVFYAGWWAFSEQNYFQVEGRRYLLGTLVRHASTGLPAVQFAPGDVIAAEQMRHAFFTVMQNVLEPEAWFIRPQSPDQVERIRAIDGQAPIVAPNAPFRGVTFQPLTPAVAYGTLRFVRAAELAASDVGPRDIVVTDQVPNDIPLIGGLITEALQTPLSHVNILSRGRGTPNMALVDARRDPRIAPYLDTLVRLEVTGAEFFVEPAAPEDALAFWESRKPEGPPLTPRLDPTVRGLQPLAERSFADLPAIGGKAAQLAELLRVPFCTPVDVPHAAFAIPVAYSLDHFEASGARALLAELGQDARFLAEPRVRAEGLARVRALIEEHPLDPELARDVAAAVAERWPGRPLRFRSSSNAEDLSGFSGAGLYESEGVDAEDVPAGIPAAIRRVWASLWTQRAYDERDFYNVDQDALGMAVLVHQAFRSERVNGVAISRDILDPTRGGRDYFNVQLGEALVTNPAPGVRSEQFTYDPRGYVPFVYHEHSTFSPGQPILSPAEVETISCNLDAIERYFRPLVDPEHENAWFAVDIEFKLMPPDRALVIKQARPYSFGRNVPTGWCDF